MLYLKEGFRRKGMGRGLIKHLEKKCKTEKLFTSTNKSNLPMQKLMKKMNYVRSGIIHNLDPDDPELIYFKKVKHNRQLNPTVSLGSAKIGKKKAIFTAAGLKSDSELRSKLKKLLEIFNSGKLKTVIDRQYPLEKVPQAHEYISLGHKKGNITIINY
jgi:hypothetical protein